MWHFYDADYICTLGAILNVCLQYVLNSTLKRILKFWDRENRDRHVWKEKKKRKTDREMEEERERIKQRQSGRVRVKIQRERLCVIMNIIQLYVHVSMALAYSVIHASFGIECIHVHWPFRDPERGGSYSGCGCPAFPILWSWKLK